MENYRYQEILIKFVDKNVPQQELRATEVTGCSFMDVRAGEYFLEVVYENASLFPLKIIYFSRTDIKEFCLNRIIDLSRLEKM